MGTISSIACRQCRVTRDLDKFYMGDSVKNRDDALKLAETMEVKGQAFRAALVVSFMVEHAGHDCVYFHENMSCEDELDPDCGSDYASDVDYWQCT